MRRNRTDENRSNVNEALRRIHEADAVLIGAGAGLSAAAGINYFDREGFAQNYPGLVKQGFTCKMDLFGFLLHWPEPKRWGYLAAHLYEVRYRHFHAPVYEQLQELTAGKPRFVLTSNVDHLFPRHGFDTEYLFTPQGDYGRLQCHTACTDQTWDTWPLIAPILPTIDPDTQEVTDASVLPVCPHCGGPLVMNVRADRYFIKTPYLGQRDTWKRWISEQARGNLVILELGCGYNTPSVVRWPLEHLCLQVPGSFMIRVNPDHPELPHAIRSRSLSLPIGAGEFLENENLCAGGPANASSETQTDGGGCLRSARLGGGPADCPNRVPPVASPLDTTSAS